MSESETNPRRMRKLIPLILDIVANQLKGESYIKAFILFRQVGGENGQKIRFLRCLENFFFFFNVFFFFRYLFLMSRVKTKKAFAHINTCVISLEENKKEEEKINRRADAERERKRKK